jgi:hypothetical protein
MVPVITRTSSLSITQGISKQVDPVREDRHVLLHRSLIGQVPQRDVAAEDAPPAVALQPRPREGRRVANAVEAVRQPGHRLRRALPAQDDVRLDQRPEAAVGPTLQQLVVIVEGQPAIQLERPLEVLPGPGG